MPVFPPAAFIGEFDEEAGPKMSYVSELYGCSGEDCGVGFRMRKEKFDWDWTTGHGEVEKEKDSEEVPSLPIPPLLFPFILHHFPSFALRRDSRREMKCTETSTSFPPRAISPTKRISHTNYSSAGVFPSSGDEYLSSSYPSIQPSGLAYACGTALVSKDVVTATEIQREFHDFCQHIASRILKETMWMEKGKKFLFCEAGLPAVAGVSFHLVDVQGRGRKRQFCIVFVHSSIRVLMSVWPSLYAWTTPFIERWEKHCEERRQGEHGSSLHMERATIGVTYTMTAARPASSVSSSTDGTGGTSHTISQSSCSTKPYGTTSSARDTWGTGGRSIAGTSSVLPPLRSLGVLLSPRKNTEREKLSTKEQELYGLWELHAAFRYLLRQAFMAPTSSSASFPFWGMPSHFLPRQWMDGRYEEEDGRKENNSGEKKPPPSAAPLKGCCVADTCHEEEGGSRESDSTHNATIQKEEDLSYMEEEGKSDVRTASHFSSLRHPSPPCVGVMDRWTSETGPDECLGRWSTNERMPLLEKVVLLFIESAIKMDAPVLKLPAFLQNKGSWAPGCSDDGNGSTDNTEHSEGEGSPAPFSGFYMPNELPTFPSSTSSSFASSFLVSWWLLPYLLEGVSTTMTKTSSYVYRCESLLLFLSCLFIGVPIRIGTALERRKSIGMKKRGGEGANGEGDTKEVKRGATRRQSTEEKEKDEAHASVDFHCTDGKVDGEARGHWKWQAQCKEEGECHERGGARLGEGSDAYWPSADAAHFWLSLVRLFPGLLLTTCCCCGGGGDGVRGGWHGKKAEEEDEEAKRERPDPHGMVLYVGVSAGRVTKISVRFHDDPEREGSSGGEGIASGIRLVPHGEKEWDDPHDQDGPASPSFSMETGDPGGGFSPSFIRRHRLPRFLHAPSTLAVRLLRILERFGAALRGRTGIHGSLSSQEAHGLTTNVPSSQTLPPFGTSSNEGEERVIAASLLYQLHLSLYAVLTEYRLNATSVVLEHWNQCRATSCRERLVCCWGCPLSLHDIFRIPALPPLTTRHPWRRFFSHSSPWPKQENHSQRGVKEDGAGVPLLKEGMWHTRGGPISSPSSSLPSPSHGTLIKRSDPFLRKSARDNGAKERKQCDKGGLMSTVDLHTYLFLAAYASF